MAKILIVDDEERIRVILKIMLSAGGHSIAEAADGHAALQVMGKKPIDLVISDIKMAGLDGMGLLAAIKERGLGCPLVFITAFATLDSAVEAMRLGAADYLVKPFEEKQVQIAVERALGFGRIMAENLALKKKLRQGGGAAARIFVSEAMQAVAAMAVKVARSEATVLITGESGTGKEVVARLIHDESSRKAERFVALNCAAISPSLVEAELFGHEKGAFTGAAQKKEGKFEYADGGTLFLDEVGDLPLEAQAKLLRAIQEKSFQRVGGNREIPVNTRLLCATNRNLEKRVAEKTFRRDLYYRLAVFPIRIAPLRERKADILPLASHFVRKFAEVGESGGDLLTPGAVKMLKDFPWPGNVRELINTIERAIILKGGQLPLTSDDLNFLCLQQQSKESVDGLFQLPATGIDFDALQSDIVRQSLAMTAGNQSAAARLLGVSRARFRTLMKQLEQG